MKRSIFLLIILLMGILISVCSDETIVSGDTDNDNDPIDSVFSISMTTDNSFTTSQTINSETGGDISLTNANGVIFTLLIPPYSLPNDTEIILTALESFDISGPVDFGCVDSSGGSNFCFEGIVCEPSGLVFDSGATLTVQFPSGTSFSIDSSITITYFDTVDQIVYPYQVSLDSTNRTISCTLYHFSGYVTSSVPYISEDQLCGMLNSQFYSLKSSMELAILPEQFINSLLMFLDLKRQNHYVNSYNPLFPTNDLVVECPGFNATVDAEIPLLLNTFWSNLASYWSEQNVEYISHMISDYNTMYEAMSIMPDYTSQQTMESILNQMKLNISNRIKTLAQSGQELCGSNQSECEDGIDILSQVLAYGDQGFVVTSSYVVDTDYLAQVENWINDCCETDYNLAISLPASSQVYRFVHNMDSYYGDPYAYVCTVNVKVTGAYGTPAEGVSVRLGREGTTATIATKLSDANGNAGFIISPRSIDWICQEFETWNLNAKYYDTEREEWTDPVGNAEVMFINTTVTTTINYQFTYEWVAGEYSSNAYASAVGSGSGPIREIGTCSPNCNGTIYRTYSYQNCNPQDGCTGAASLEDDGVYGCRTVATIESISTSDGRTVDILNGASVNIGSSIFAGLVYARSDGSLDTLQYGLEMSVWPEEGFYFSSEDGVDDDTTWTWDSSSDPNATGLKTVTYSVSVSVDN